jgi:hypothetical protein
MDRYLAAIQAEASLNLTFLEFARQYLTEGGFQNG